MSSEFRPIILVGSCKKNQGNLDAIRQTWGKNSAIPYKFFMGEGCVAKYPDEFVVNTPDGYFHQIEKHKAALAWALAQGYNAIFLADDDTFIHTKRLLASYNGEDYKGNTFDTPRPPDPYGVPWDFCHGGPGYWLSEKAARIIIAAPKIKDENPAPIDDQFFAKVLLEAGIVPVHDPRFSMGRSYGRKEFSVTPNNDIISEHLSWTMGKYEKAWMHTAYAKSLKVLIACCSCWRDVTGGSNEAIRKTWAKDLPEGWDLKFFLGGVDPSEDFIVPMDSPGPGSIGNLSDDKGILPKLFTAVPVDDEVVLQVPDGYFYLPWKTTESLRWALERGYDYIFRCFTDTYLFVDRLMQSEFYRHDFSGRSFFCPPCKSHPKAKHTAPHGGAGYWLSRKAAQIVVDYPEQSHWGEDTHVGFVMSEAGIPLFNEGRLFDPHLGANENRPKLTRHLNERAQKWNPKLMYDAHNARSKDVMTVRGPVKYASDGLTQNWYDRHKV